MWFSNSRRGHRLVGGSDLGVQCSHCGWRCLADADQAYVENTFDGWCADNRDENPRSSPNGQNIDFWADLTGTPWDNAGNLLRRKAWSTWTCQRCHLHPCGSVRDEEGWSWVSSISRSKVNHGCWTPSTEAWWKLTKCAGWQKKQGPVLSKSMKNRNSFFLELNKISWKIPKNIDSASYRGTA